MTPVICHPQQSWTDTLGSVSFSWMLDRTFKNDWYLSLSYLYTGQPVDYTGGSIFSGNLTAKSLFPFRHTLYSGVSKVLNPAWQASAALIYSPTNNSLIFFPVISCNISSQWDADLTMQAFFSDGPDGYRSRGTAIFFRVKWSF